MGPGRVALTKVAGYAEPVTPSPPASRPRRLVFTARPRLMGATVLALGVAVLACRPGADGSRTPTEPASAPAPEAAAAVAPPAPTSSDTLDPATARAEARKILESVAIARNLPLKRDVVVDVISKQGIREFAKESMYEHTTPKELRMLGRIDSSLGVIPVGADVEQILLDLLEEGVLGLYDPKVKTLFIGDFVTRGMLSMVVGHEIAHGLQDMYFDLNKLQDPILHDSDAESARRFLVEGDAQASYLAWVSGEAGVAAIDDAVLDAMGDQVLELGGTTSAHPVLARALQMPYTDGTATVIRLVKASGWTAVDELYAKLPTTSEQLLHLDKLVARERAIPTKLDVGALERTLPGLSLVWHDNLGEAALLSMLAEVDDATVARKATTGWGGDFFIAMDDEAKPLPAPVVAGVIAWDTELDAREFVPVFTRYLDGHAAQRSLVDRKGSRVVFATGVPADVDVRALTAALWRGTHVGK